MNRSMKYLSGVGVVAVVTMALGVQEANAGWGSHGSHGGRSGWGSHGSAGGGWGSHGSAGGGWGSQGSAGGSWGSYGGGGWSSHGSAGGGVGHHRIGPIRRLLKSHRQYHGNYYIGWGSSGGGWGSHGSSGGSSGGSWGSSGGSWGSSSPSMYAPSQGSDYVPMDPSSGELPGPDGQTSAARGEALLAVQVPESARVYVNGRPTTSTGSFRQYLSRGLDRGMSYTYEVRAEATINGQTVEQTKSVKLHAGETADLAFDLAARPETTLTLRVPENARVILAGQETQGKGELRVFRTTALDSGDEWSNYAIRVVLDDKDGDTLVREESISLKAGESRTLAVQFDAPKIASAR